MTDEYPYPEHEKLARIRHDAQLISEFLEYLSSEGLVFSEYDDAGNFYQVYRRPQDLIGGFLEIDPDKLDKEKLAMLDMIRKANEEAKDRATGFTQAQITSEAVSSTRMDKSGDGQTFAIGPVTTKETNEKPDSQDTIEPGHI